MFFGLQKHTTKQTLNRLGATIEEVAPSDAESKISRLIVTEVAPRLVEYQNEMASIRDKLFGDLLKSIKWQVPSISIGVIAGLGFGGALAAFVGGLSAAAGPAIPGLVDYVQAKRSARRKNAFSYLIRLVDEAR